MAVIAYASGDQGVGQNPPINFTETHDPFLDMAAAGFAFPQNVQLYGNAVDSANPGANISYQWALLSQSEQAPAATLSNNGTTQDVIVQGVNAWGNIRVFLIATNTATNETSETDPLKAPDSAFVTVRVRSSNASIQKPAAGERNWDNDTNEWAQAIEDLAAAGVGIGDHNIIDHLDVVDATGADLEALTSGGYADDPDGANPNAGGRLHKHRGPDVDEATVAVRGTVGIESNHTATAINVETDVFTARSGGTHTFAGEHSGISTVHVPGGNVEIQPWNRNHIDFFVHNQGPLYVKEVYLSLDNGGLANPVAAGFAAYKFQILQGTQAQWEANAQNILFALEGAPAANNKGLILSNNARNDKLEKGDVLSVRVSSSPHKGDDFRNLGHGLSVTIYLHRKAGNV